MKKQEEQLQEDQARGTKHIFEVNYADEETMDMGGDKKVWRIRTSECAALH